MAEARKGPTAGETLRKRMRAAEDAQVVELDGRRGHQAAEGMTKMSLDLPSDLHRDLKFLALREGVTLAAILQAGGEQYRERDGHVDWDVAEVHKRRRSKKS